MLCLRCQAAPATCEVMILSAERGYPRVVLCGPCHRDMTYEEAGNAYQRFLTLFDGPIVLLTRAQTRRLRFMLHWTWENDEDPENDVDLLVEPDFDLPENADKLFEGELARVESPVALHYYAMNHNWDDGEEALQAVLDHPLCDAGTALMIDWLAQPDLCLGWEADGKETDGLAFIKQVQARLVAGDFSLGQVRFDPRSFMGHDHTVPEGGSTGMHLIPAALKEPTPGRELEYIRF